MHSVWVLVVSLFAISAGVVMLLGAIALERRDRRRRVMWVMLDHIEQVYGRP